MKLYWGALISVLLFCAPDIARAQSAVDEIRVGLLAHGWGGPGANREQGADINLEILFSSPGFAKALGAPRPHIGASIATDQDATSQIYAGLEWSVGLTKHVFAAASLGGAIHNGETKFNPVADAGRLGDTVFLGCRALFRLGGDLGYNLSDHIRASVHAEHISNAGLCAANEGLDNFGLRLGYRF